MVATGSRDRAGAHEQSASDLDRRFCELLVRHLAARGSRLFATYLAPYFALGPDEVAPVAHTCGRKIFIATARPYIWRQGKRRIAYCVRCGFISDVPEQAAIRRFDVNPDHRATVSTMIEDWEGPVFVGVGYEPEGVLTHKCPPPRLIESDGGLVEGTFRLGAGLGPGLQWTFVVMVWNGFYALARSPVYR